MKEYTKKEGEAISRAYYALEYMCASHDFTAIGRLVEALKHERREHSSIKAAKALIVQCAVEDYRANAYGLYSMASGCAAAAMVGAVLRKDYRDRPRWRRFLRQAKAAKAANEASTDRAFQAAAAG